MALVAVAGPVSNVAVAFLLALIIRIAGAPGDLLSDLLSIVIFINLLLAAINLIPIFPLDGSKVMMGIVPGGLATSLARLERYGPMVLILFIMVNYVTGLRLLGGFYRQIDALRTLVVGG